MRLIAITYVSLVSAIALAARYQYSTDLLMTVFVTLLVCTHHWTPKLARFLFIKAVRETAMEDEGVALVRKSSDEV